MKFATLLLCVATATAAAAVPARADWAQWRGPSRDGRATPAFPLKDISGPLKSVWKVNVGPGFAGPVVAGGRVYLVDDSGGRETAHAFDAATGREVWHTAYAGTVGDEWGKGPRATPFVDGDRLFVQSANGEFCSLLTGDGSVAWKLGFERDYGVRFLGSKAGEGTATRRGNSGAGLVSDGRVYVPVGGTRDASLVCRERDTGRELWRAGTDEAAYSSLILATLAGSPQVVYLNGNALCGHDPLSGRVLWRVPLVTNAKRHAATPVALGNDLIAVNSHTFGLIAFRITRSGDTFTAAGAWTNKALKINLATPVLVDGHLYSHGAGRNYVCVDAATGEVKWTSAGFGFDEKKDWSATVAVGDRLLVLTESGELIELAADPTRPRLLGRTQVSGRTWCHPAVANGRIYVRDQNTLQCLELPR